MYPRVKPEPQDEEEIQEMANKLVAEYQAKLQSVAGKRSPPVMQGMGLLSFLASSKKNETSTLGDEESLRGRFGWVTLGKEHIPYIIRKNEKYCAVRMVEVRLLNKYFTFLHQDICNCTCIRSYYITETESRLLNEINMRHCDSQFGQDQFTCRDLIVRLSDAIEFHLFLDSCYTKLLNGRTSANDRCGFIRINKDSVVPYTVYNMQKYVPLFYFEGETETLQLNADTLEGWDLAYLKFCCKVQGIRNELFAHDSCSVIGLSDIKSYFPNGTVFEDYWPNKVVDSQLLINGKAQPQVGQWTRQPAGGPPALVVHSTPSPKNEVPTNSNPTNNTRLQLYPGYSLPATQPSFPLLPQRGTNTAIRQHISPSVVARSGSRQTFFPMNPTSTSAPLGRPTQTTPTFLNSPPVPATNFLMLGETTIVPTTYQPAPPSPAISAHLVLNGSDAYYDTSQEHFLSNDIVDLSRQSRTLPPQISIHPVREQPQQQEIHNVTNGRPALPIHQKMVSIADTPTTRNNCPYKIQKAFIENKMMLCVNMKPYMHTDMLVTVADIAEQLFSNIPIQSCQQVMQVLGIELYKGNSSQMKLLIDNGKCKDLNDYLPLVPVRHVLEFMPQLKYMLGGLISAEAAAKRLRSS